MHFEKRCISTEIGTYSKLLIGRYKLVDEGQLSRFREAHIDFVPFTINIYFNFFRGVQK